MKKVAGGRMELVSLVDELEEIERRGAKVGGFASAQDSGRWEQIERRLFEIISQPLSKDEQRKFMRLVCNLKVSIYAGETVGHGVVIDFGAGGVFVETQLQAQVGAVIDLELDRNEDAVAYGLKIPGKVTWSLACGANGSPGLGIAFVAHDEVTERNVRRFVIELVRKQLPPA